MEFTLDKLLLKQDTNDEFIRRLMTSLVASTSSANTVPFGTGFAFANTSDEFSQLSKHCSNHIDGIIADLTNFVSSDTLIDDFSDSAVYDHLVDLMEKLLEDADLRMDELGGKKKAAMNASWTSVALDKDRILLGNVQDIEKPQITYLFEPINNRREDPFAPKILMKYNQIVPLNIFEQESAIEGDVIAPHKFFCHPYEAELNALKLSPEIVNSIPNLQPIFPSSNQSFEFIDNIDDLERMIDELLTCSEIAIDLEHHSYRSFQGFTCLIQISSRNKDYIVDALQLRSVLHNFNKVTTHPNIIKVFHGAESDTLWLQKDFGVYIVNCFDTFHAAKLLRFPALSLAHLLRVYCQYTANKKYQLADWRVRPLPQEMLNYARDDTHYLLYIFDCLRQEIWKLHGKEGLELVFQACKKVCLQRYEKEFFWPLGYRKLLTDHLIARCVPNLKASGVSEIQDAILASLWNWRDLQARQWDESPAFIMSNAELLKLGLRIPRKMIDFESCGPFSTFVRENASAILALIQEQLEIQPSDGNSSSPLTPVKTRPSSSQNGKNKVVAHINTSVSSSSSSSAAAAEDSRLYGRALHTPCKDLNTSASLCPEENDMDGFVEGAESAGGNGLMDDSEGLLHQPYGYSTIFQGRLSASLDGSMPFNQSFSSDTSVNRSLDGTSHLNSVFETCKWKTTSCSEEQPEDSTRDPIKLHDNNNINNSSSSSSSSRSSNTVFSSNGSDKETEHLKLEILQLFLGPMRAVPNSSAVGSSSSHSQSNNSKDNNSSTVNNLHSKHGSVTMTEEQVFDTLPSSFADIYNLSNDIRKRNRDKKKTSDEVESGNQNRSSNSPLGGVTTEDSHNEGMSSSKNGSKKSSFPSLHPSGLDKSILSSVMFDDKLYSSFVGVDSQEKNLESNLDMAAEVGWIQEGEQRNRVREAYLADQQLMADAESAADCDQSNSPKVSLDNKKAIISLSNSSLNSGTGLSGNSGAASSSHTGTAATHVAHSALATGVANGATPAVASSASASGISSSSNKIYDYGKLPQHMSMGAMPTSIVNNSSSSVGASGRQASKSSSGMGSSKSNPYLNKKKS